MKPKFQVGDVITGNTEKTKKFKAKCQVIDIGHSYYLEILKITNQSKYQEGDRAWARSFEFIDENYTLDQSWLNEQEMKKLLGVGTK